MRARIPVCGHGMEIGIYSQMYLLRLRTSVFMPHTVQSGVKFKSVYKHSDFAHIFIHTRALQKHNILHIYVEDVFLFDK